MSFVVHTPRSLSLLENSGNNSATMVNCLRGYTVAGVGSISGGQRSLQWMCLWPEMEKELFDLFWKERQKGKLIRSGWFRYKTCLLFVKHYGPGVIGNMFVFSVGLFNRFMKRWSISC